MISKKSEFWTETRKKNFFRLDHQILISIAAAQIIQLSHHVTCIVHLSSLSIERSRIVSNVNKEASSAMMSSDHGSRAKLMDFIVNFYCLMGRDVK